jgi:8-oxo-dGTP pyrophosphatase MutT (NUDIX family)
MKTSASFVVILINNMVCATTRLDNTIGLPGGLTEVNETPIQTALREAEEEGWEIDLAKDSKIIHLLTDIVNDRVISWILIDSNAEIKEDYLEKSRGIKPILVSIDEIKKSGRGNDLAIDLAIRVLKTIKQK